MESERFTNDDDYDDFERETLEPPGPDEFPDDHRADDSAAGELSLLSDDTSPGVALPPPPTDMGQPRFDTARAVSVATASVPVAGSASQKTILVLTPPRPSNPFAAAEQSAAEQAAAEQGGITGAKGKKTGGEDKDERAQMLEIALEFALFHDNHRTPFAAVPGIPHAVDIGSSEFRDLLQGLYVKRYGAYFNGSLTPLVRILTYKANNESETQPVFTRFAHRVKSYDDYEIGIDLANKEGEAIVVNANGWRVTTEHGFNFRRFGHMQALPHPKPNGNLLELFDLMKLRYDNQRLLLVPWIVLAPLEIIPRPILTLFGPQGSAKSNTGLHLKNLLDPIPAKGLYVPKNLMELCQNLHHHAIPLFDNLSCITEDLGNILCMGCTGGGISKRKLYTDGDDVLMCFQRAMIITAINVPYNAQDLLDRSFCVELERLTRKECGYVTKIWDEYESMKPSYLGGLLDLLAGALGRVHGIRLDNLPRLADFCRWGAAVAEELGEAKGFGQTRFVDAMFEASSKAYGDSLGDDPLPTLLLGFFSGLTTPVTGTISELHEQILLAAQARGLGGVVPKSPSALSRRLKSYLVLLETRGWRVTFSDSARDTRKVTITRIPG